jgi:hypothetical protein
MATSHKQTTPKRAPLKARPRPDADAVKTAEQLSERFSESLAYLGR